MRSLRSVDAPPVRRLAELLRELVQLDCEGDWSAAQVAAARLREALGRDQPAEPPRFGLEIAAIRQAALAMIDGIEAVVRAANAAG